VETGWFLADWPISLIYLFYWPVKFTHAQYDGFTLNITATHTHSVANLAHFTLDLARPTLQFHFYKVTTDTFSDLFRPSGKKAGNIFKYIILQIIPNAAESNGSDRLFCQQQGVSSYPSAE